MLSGEFCPIRQTGFPAPGLLNRTGAGLQPYPSRPFVLTSFQVNQQDQLYQEVRTMGRLTLTAAQLAELQKSAETPMLEATPDYLGPHGLWWTPTKKVPVKQKLPNLGLH